MVVPSVESFVGWAESDGLVAAISHPAPSNKAIFMYPTLLEVGEVSIVDRIFQLIEL